MATWKKVITSDDSIGIGQGGTGNTAFTDGIAVTSDTSNGGGGITTLALTSGHILVGNGAQGVSSTVGGDIEFSGTSGTSTWTITTDAVDADKLKDDEVQWAVHQKDVAGNRASIPTWKTSSGTAALLAPGEDGQVLKYTGDELTWGTAGSSSTVTINTKSDSIEYPVIFKSATDTVAVDAGATDFTYNPSNNKLTATAFIGALEGNATSATKIARADGSGESTNNPIFFAEDANVTGDSSAMCHSSFYYDATDDGGTLRVPNIVVSGNTTTLNVGELKVEDANIEIATVDGTGIQTDANAAGISGGAGMRVFITGDDGNGGAVTISDTHKPMIRYAGSASTQTANGWMVRKNLTNSTAVETGIATLDYENVTGSTDMANAANSAVGIGALKLTSNGLWIQTA